MQNIFEINIEKTAPAEADILKAQGIPDNIKPDKRIIELTRQSLTIYNILARPKGITGEVSTEQFETIYKGYGNNEPKTPLGNIYKLADKLTLFAVSIGEEICAEISRLFEQKDFALASMLDSAASEGVERTAIIAERNFADNLPKVDNQSSIVATRFSPGYCGWHISGQKKLFDYLCPQKIGITLADSFLMDPLKSISGVLVAGKQDIFEFDDDYVFCADCADHSCRDRTFSSPEVIK